jgi:polysaccharide biosynthesis transport protein
MSGGRSPSREHSTRDRLIFVLWRRRWLLAATALLITGVTAVVSKNLPERYEATATLWVTEKGGTAALDAVQAGEVLARTYAKVADSPILAGRVAAALPFEANRGTVQGAMEFEPVDETQLLRITADDGDPARARTLANTYASELIDYSEAQLGDAARSEIAFADPASAPSQPARPKPTLYTTVGAFLGLLAGVALAFLAEALDRRIRTREELEHLVGAPTLAHVPLRGSDAASAVGFAETFRLLRTNIEFMHRDAAPLRSIAVISPSEGDGKSSVSYNLALSLAEAGHSVILIEADMRRPGLQRHVLVDGGESVDKGLSAYLSLASAGMESVLRDTAMPGLRFIPAGVLPPAPSTLLDGARSRALLDDAMSRATTVIIDTPPLSVGAEASTLAASADAALMVVDLRVSNKPRTRAARDQLDVVGARLLGVVLNRVRSMPDMGAYAYRYVDNGDDKQGRRRPRRRRAAQRG